MRTIKFLGDTGSPIKVEAEDNLILEQFIKILTEAGGEFDLNKQILTHDKTRATFLTEDAILPDGDIRLFATVKDPKGNISRQECYKYIKNSGDIEFFNKTKNYNNKTTSELLDLIVQHKYSRENQESTELTCLEILADGNTLLFIDEEGFEYHCSTVEVAQIIRDSEDYSEDLEFKELKKAQESFKFNLKRN